MPIAFMDLKTQFGLMSDEIRAGIDNVLQHGRYIMGPEVTELEARLAKFTGVKHAISCSSGTDALLMPLMAFGIGPGDAVFTTPFTFFATAEVIALLGATPVFVDIDARTFNIDPDALEAAVSRVEKEGKLVPKGIIPVDLFGLPADYRAIQTIADRHGLFVIEDAAQSIGGSYHGKPVGSLAQVASTSFYPAKPLGCYGDGGSIFTDDDELAETLISIRVHGQGKDKYQNVRLGINGRLDSIQAAILLVKLDALQGEIEKRRQVAQWYSECLTGVNLPLVPEHYNSAWALYSVLCENRDGLKQHLADKGIPSVIYYIECLHLQKAFAHLNYRPGQLPVSEQTATKILSLPMHPFLTKEEVHTVAAAVSEFN